MTAANLDTLDHAVTAVPAVTTGILLFRVGRASPVIATTTLTCPYHAAAIQSQERVCAVARDMGVWLATPAQTVTMVTPLMQKTVNRAGAMVTAPCPRRVTSGRDSVCVGGTPWDVCVTSACPRPTAWP